MFFKKIKDFFLSFKREENESALDDIIVNSIDDVLRDEELYQELKKTIIKKLCDIVDMSLSYSGDAYSLVNKKVNECIVKGINKSDFSSYTIRLEKVMNDILNEIKSQDGSIVSYSKILENFKMLMCPAKELPDKVISFEDLYDEYCRFVRETIETTNDVKVYYEVHTDYQSERFIDRYIKFYVEGYEDRGFCHSFSLFMFKKEQNDIDEYTILTVPADKFNNILSVKDLTWFDIKMLHMKQNFIKITFNPNEDYEGDDYKWMRPDNEYE